MARRKARIPQGKKIQPAPLTLFTLFTVEEGGTKKYADLSQMCSLVNRRFYRQGLEWAVAGIKVISQNSGEVSVCKIPSTWIASNAWEKGFRTWQRMNNKALEEAESVKPKFLDFKVFMDKEHHSLGVGDNLLPYSGDGSGIGSQLFNAGEWEMSKILTPDTTTPGSSDNFEIIWTGANFPGGGASGLNAVSLIEGYAASRGLPDILDPNTPDDAADSSGATPENWMSAIFNEGTTQQQQVLLDMIDENNLAPYPFENDGVHTDTMYPGGANQGTGVEVHDIIHFSATTISETSYVKGGMFPGGLIKFDCTNFEAGSPLFVMIDLIPGEHRGYHCRSMQDV